MNTSRACRDVVRIVVIVISHVVVSWIVILPVFVKDKMIGDVNIATVNTNQQNAVARRLDQPAENAVSRIIGLSFVNLSRNDVLLLISCLNTSLCLHCMNQTAEKVSRNPRDFFLI